MDDVVQYLFRQIRAFVPGVSNDEGSEDRSDTSSRSSDSNGGSSGSDELGSAVNVLLDGGGVDGLDRGGSDGPHGGHGQAGRHGETSDGRHSSGWWCRDLKHYGP